MASAVRMRGSIHVSKNKKKNWRKYSDISDVEKFLEEQRLEERTGGCVSDKSNEQLFFTDTRKTCAKEKRLLAKNIKKLKCHNAVCYSSVPPPIKVKQGLGKKLEARCFAAEARKLKNIAKSFQPSKSHQNKKFEGIASHDLWDEDELKELDPEMQELVDYRDEITRKRPVKAPNHLYQKPSLLPAVEVPHPGASYNPSYEDHKDLLHKAVEVEVKKAKEELHLKRVLTDMFPVKSEAPTEETWISEMSQGLFDEANNDVANEDVSKTSNCLSLNPAVTVEGKKNKSKRNREKHRKQLEWKRQQEKNLKHEMNKVFQVRRLISEIKEKEFMSQLKQQKKEKLKIDKLYKPRVISQYKYEPNDIEVNLSEELVGSLRELKVDGNILEDRYKSLQRRNIIETRIRQKRKRKYKLKVQVKRSHRDFT